MAPTIARGPRGPWGTFRSVPLASAARFATRPASRVRRVLLVGKPTGPAAPGGGEVQLEATAAALRQLGVDVRVGWPQDDDVRHADCLHLLGSEPEHLPLIQRAKRYDVPTVLSTIAWFDLASRWHEPGPRVQRWLGSAKLLAQTAAPWLPTWRRRLYHAVDVLLPNSQAEAEQFVRIYSVPRRKIHVVLNGADLRFAQATAHAFIERYGVSDFVLYAGRIEPRKNQLHFLRAMQSVDVPIVILGDVVPGQEWYLDRCRRRAGPRVQFLPRLEHDDPLLASAYAACRCLVLASWFETPGLVALEAGLLGTPVVLTERGCTREYFGPHARYVNPGDVSAIRSAVIAAMHRQRSPALAALVRENYTWQAAAAATLAAYGRVWR
jgi:glycosyltransferase involved in cell wall biosynthesis